MEEAVKQAIKDAAPLRFRDSETGGRSWFWPVVILYSLAIAYLMGKDALAAVVRSHAFILLLMVSLIVVAGIVLYRSGLSLRVKVSGGVGAGTLLLLAGIVFYGNAVSLLRNPLVLACSILLTGFLLVNALTLPDWARKLAVCVIVFLVLLDAGIVRYFPVPGTSKSAIPDIIVRHKGWIEEHAGYSRVVAWKKYLHNSASSSGVFDVDHYEPLTLLRWSNFVRFVMGPTKFDEANNYFRPFYGKPSRYGLSFLRHRRLLGLCSLRYLIAWSVDPWEMSYLGAHSWILVPKGSPAGSHTYIFENKLALPRAYLVSSYVTTGNEEESLAAIGDNISELPHSVVLENGAPSFPSATEPRIPGAARIVDYGINIVELRVESQEPSLLVLTDSYYPGWVASVDGEKKPIWRANSLFRAVEVPTGSHRVVFRYRPASLYLGMAVSLVTLLLVAAGLLVQAHRSRSADKKARMNAD